MREGDTLHNFDSPDPLKTSRGGTTATLIMSFTCCSVSLATRNMLEVQRPNFGKDLMFTNLILEHTHANTTKTLSIKGNRFHKQVFSIIFFEDRHNGSFRVGIKIIDGADDVFSLRRKELFWQYRLQTFSPKGLNERAADVELDVFACGGTT